MKKPYSYILKSFELDICRLGFKCVNDNEYGVTFMRKDGFRLEISIERYAAGFSVGIIHEDYCLLPNALMETFDLQLAEATKKKLQDTGFSENGIRDWMEIFLRFLDANKEIIFQIPLPQPYRDIYTRIQQRNLNELGLNI